MVDNINYGVLVYDNTGEWPVYRSTFPTTASADWITMGLDGQYAYLSSADIVDVKTKKIVGQMKDEYGRPMHSEKFLELAFRETPGKEYGTDGRGEAGAHGEPVRTRYPERRGGEARTKEYAGFEVDAGSVELSSRWSKCSTGV